MNKNIIVVGAMAVGLYLLSQANKIKKAVVKKKAPRRPLRKYPKPHPYLKPKIKRVIPRKKPIYYKPKPKIAIPRKKPIYYKPKPRVAISRKKPIYYKPKPKIAIPRKKPIYYKPKPKIAVWKKQIIKRMAQRKRRR